MSQTSGRISDYALLGTIDTPADLRRLPIAELPSLAAEIRRFLIETLARSGGHFAANLGTVELAIALHYVLDTPEDRLIWDVGHQAYPHKLLTGRGDRLQTMRRLGGLAPFLTRSESPYDAFGAGHSSTSLSAAAGMAIAARLANRRRRVVAVIGDGGLTAGMAFEALNHIGALGLDVLVVCNDNDMSISENVGALRDHAARALARSGHDAPHAARPAAESGDSLSPQPIGALFESLGFAYHGPVDGHDAPRLIARLETLKDLRGPQFLHAITFKGKGFAAAEADPIGYHGVTAFDPATGQFPPKSAPVAPSYSDVFGDWLCAAAARDPRVVAITPAMREGSGLKRFAKQFPHRYFDVGIAEQHAVTLAAGMACEGLRPVVAIYSTFLQRAYDQLIHDVAIQNLPVLFAIDRGGLVGADGATHHGAFDLAYLRDIPNLAVMAPSDADECRHMLDAGLAGNGPTAVRYPRGVALAFSSSEPSRSFHFGQGQLVRKSAKVHDQPHIAFLNFGALLGAALEAAETLDATVADMRFVKPLDQALILQLAQSCDLLVTIEDGVRLGGAGSAAIELLQDLRQLTPVLTLGLPDQFIEHGSREELLTACGLDCGGILRSVQTRLRAIETAQSLTRGP